MAVVFDYIFIFTGGFAVGFIWSRYYFKDVTVCFLIGLFAALIFYAADVLFLKNISEKATRKRKKPTFCVPPQNSSPLRKKPFPQLQTLTEQKASE